MKTLFMSLALLTVSVACNKTPKAELNQEQEEARQDYREEVNEASKDRSEEMNEAREDYQEAQKEEASDYVDESESVDLNKNQQRIKVNETDEQD